MKEVELKMIERAKELLTSGKVNRVVGWKKGLFDYDPEPATFDSVEQLEDFVYNGFCGANLSKYMINVSKKEGVSLVFLKPCDTLSFNQLLKEYKINREKVYVIGVSCEGKLDPVKKQEKGEDVLLGRCIDCKGKEHAVFDEKIEAENLEFVPKDRFSKVKELENMTADERFNFWQKELSKCIRCNACRNVCPACTCIKCVFDNPNSGISAKANDVSFEEQMYHIIRAFHVSGRCTDCGECSRVCPQNIPLHLLNRKFIKDINENYGEYQAGKNLDEKSPLTSFTTSDIEPNDAVRGDE